MTLLKTKFLGGQAANNLYINQYHKNWHFICNEFRSGILEVPTDL
jgi:hypothetical protein